MRPYYLILGALCSAPALAGDKPTIGLTVNRVSKGTYQHLGLKAPVRIVNVWPNCSAEEELVKGDLLTEVKGELIDSPQTLTSLVQEHVPGDQLSVVFYHDGERKEVQLVVGRRAINGCEKATANNASDVPLQPQEPVSSPSATPGSSDSDLVTQLERLKKLYDDGILTEDEFKSAKARALNIEEQP